MHKTAAVYRDFDPECELIDHISSWLFSINVFIYLYLPLILKKQQKKL